MPGEKVTWSGKTKAKKTKVVLQVAKGKKWKKITTTRTDRKGRFTVPVTGAKSPSTAKYRLARGMKTLAQRKVTTVAQTATLSNPVDVGGNQVEMTATFTPARPGRKVSLMTFVDGAWAFGPNKTQNAAGQVTYAVTKPGNGGSITVRATAFPHNGAASVSSTSRDVTGQPIPTPTPTGTPTVQPTATPTATPTPGVDPLPEVVSIDSTSDGSLDAYDPATGTMRFDDTAPAGVRTAAPGTIIAVPITAVTPYGALREVVSATTNADGSTTIETIDGVLAEAVASTPDAARNVDMQHVSTQIVSLADGVTVVPQARVYQGKRMPRRLIPDFSAAWAEDDDYSADTIDLALSGIEKDFGDYGEVEIDGNISVTPVAELDLDLDVDWDWVKTKVVVKNYKIGAGADIDSALNVRLVREVAELEVTDAEYPVADLHHKFMTAIGAVPVVVDVNHKVFVTLSIEGEIGVVVKAAYEGRAIAGVQSTSDYDINPDWYGEMPDGSASLRVGAFGSAEVFAGYSFAANLYAAAGPTIQVGIKAEASGELGAPIEFSKDFSWRNLGRWDFAECEVSVGPTATVGIALSDAIQDLIGNEVALDLSVLPKDPWWETECPDPDDKAEIGASVGDMPAGADYTTTLTTADGRDGDWKVVDGYLPYGLALEDLGDGSAQVYGRPTQPWTYRFTLRFTDDHGRQVDKRFTIVVTGQPVDPVPGAPNWIDYADNFADGTVGEPYEVTLVSEPGDGNQAQGAWSRVVDGSLPPGLSLNLNPANAGGIVYGTPTTAGTYTFTIAGHVAPYGVVEAFGSRTFTVVIVAKVFHLPDGVEGVRYSHDLAGLYAGPAGTSWSWRVVGGDLPESYRIGYPLQNGAPWTLESFYRAEPGTYKFTLELRDEEQRRRLFPVQLAIRPDPSAVALFNLPDLPSVLYEGQPYSALLLDNSRYTERVGIRVAPGQTLPPGLSITTGAETRLVGTPTTAGTYSFYLELEHRDADWPGGVRRRTSVTYTFTVVDDQAQTVDVPADLLPDGVEQDLYAGVGTLYLNRSLPQPPAPAPVMRWKVVGRLPYGMGVSNHPYTGLARIGGYAYLAGTYTFTLVGTTDDGQWYSEREFTMVIAPATPTAT